ncbi:MAG TPA: hypothetical protein VN043_07650 [Rhodanobacter sp.]|nr:hypothetical protein [Rhodanobacter sp.]
MHEQQTENLLGSSRLRLRKMARFDANHRRETQLFALQTDRRATLPESAQIIQAAHKKMRA